MKLRRIIGSGKLESGNSKEQVNLVENSQKLMEGMKPKITEVVFTCFPYLQILG